MSLVNITNMVVLSNPSSFLSPLQFEITFTCLSPLPLDIDFRVIYVGSADNPSHDQVLDEVSVGPVPVGTNKFVLQADGPNPALIPSADLLGVTVVLVTCSYNGGEFTRVGYYVNNEIAVFSPEESAHNLAVTTKYERDMNEYAAYMSSLGVAAASAMPPPPLPPSLSHLATGNGQIRQPVLGPLMPFDVDVNRVVRTILADKPRVTRFPIDWGVDSMTIGAVFGNNNTCMQDASGCGGMEETPPGTAVASDASGSEEGRGMAGGNSVSPLAFGGRISMEDGVMMD